MQIVGVAKKSSADKRVFEIVATLKSVAEWRRLAVSADATLVDLFLTVFGAFRWRDMYAGIDREYRVVVDRVDGGKAYEGGRGSRTALRRVMDVGTALRCEDVGGDFAVTCTVEKSYTVQSRRHYPKMLDGGPDCNTQLGTWAVQGAARREYEYRDRPHDAGAAPSAAFVYGLWSAAIAGPLVMPSEWLPYATPEGAFDDLADAQEQLGALLGTYDVVAQMLQHDRDAFIERTATICNENDDGSALIEWGQGFATCMALRSDEWTAVLRDEEFTKAFTPIAIAIGMKRGGLNGEIARDAGTRGELATAVGMSTIVVAEYWRKKFVASRATVRRESPKVGANEPCPCGSGKKYKRCCGSHLRVV